VKISITDILIGLFVLMAAVFTAAYFYGWNQNAIAGSKYDLPNLLETAKWVMGQLVALFSSHSLLNTPIPWLQKKDNTINNEGDMPK
jgi:hypothetical protein